MSNLAFEGPASANVSSGQQVTDYAVGGRVTFPNDIVSLDLYAARYGENFRPALGFIQRPGTYELYGLAQYRFRTNGFFRASDIGAASRVFLLLNGSPQTIVATPFINIQDEPGDVFYAEYAFLQESLEQPFPIIDALVIPTGRYPAHRFGTNLDTSRNRALYTSLYFSLGGYYTGSLMEGSALVGWNADKHFNMNASYGQTNGYLNEGDFIIRFVTAGANVLASPLLTLNTRVQWDTISQTAGFYARIRYEPSPGQELFLVVNQGFDVDDRLRFTKTLGQLTIKLGMTIFL